MPTVKPSAARHGSNERNVRLFWEELRHDYEIIAARLDNVPAGMSVIQVEGEFGGGQLALEGSVNGTDFHPMLDVHDRPILFSQPGIAEISTGQRYIRPLPIAGENVPAETPAMDLNCWVQLWGVK